ncbi:MULTISPECIES: cytochrome d ubiquinol oxidase subunit II [Alkalihalophilus]|jgi:cytochrome d ubiquinol oxidase subunit II|uniref:Membrane protein n=1 Tax=Alkalihalophilus marmarensis DSM 21297 TaxID=1188261 RepID=U6SJU4_9BACI|nr:MULTISPECIES: cytochrome d ubiquinol oxidase subunit II [Alkalihalophilus]ERN51215.1 membrane protein [Alkalihalophilus marmarensis DSM 21297]MCM3490262.1 cytochrome d ubiquinol oxidase subunit II [Alkalihalophilus marmarensis]MEC2072373.1 cytochrome d ubiquinol oxidase subunit II [Alkalihalophilus marmarensis]WEG17472.1 cytochrome d ubiquinol oxidase subunit II [Alkalihalophilus pseudofirmus]
MENVYIAIIILWVFLFVYAIAGSIDFGAGFWAMFYRKRTDTKAASIANRYLSPSWEVTNVFLVLLVVALVGFFPGAASSLGTIMIVPFCLVLILLTIRSAFMVYSYSVQKYTNMLVIISGVTGLLIPALLISILPAAIGGFVETVGDRQYVLVNQLFTSPTFYTHLGFGISTELFLSSLLLSDYAREANSEETYHVYRKNAIILGPITLAFAVAAIFTLIPEAFWMFENMANEWLLFSLSLLAFSIGYSALWWPSKKVSVGQPRAAVLLIAAQFGLASFAYGSAHMPYFLYPDVTIYDAFTNDTMFGLLLIGYGVGMAVLVPIFIFFWRLFMKDKRYLKQEG